MSRLWYICIYMGVCVCERERERERSIWGVCFLVPLEQWTWKALIKNRYNTYSRNMKFIKKNKIGTYFLFSSANNTCFACSSDLALNKGKIYTLSQRMGTFPILFITIIIIAVVVVAIAIVNMIFNNIIIIIADITIIITYIIVISFIIAIDIIANCYLCYFYRYSIVI